MPIFRFIGRESADNPSDEQIRPEKRKRKMSNPILSISRNATLSTTRNVAVNPKLKYSADKTIPAVQQLDKDTNLPLWLVSFEVGDKTSEGRAYSSIEVKWAAATAPVLQPMTDYSINGELSAMVMNGEGNARPKVYWTLQGTLTPVNASAPQARKQD
jgi:hypothetical protein